MSADLCDCGICPAMICLTAVTTADLTDRKPVLAFFD